MKTTVKIPDKDKDGFSLFADGVILDKQFIKGEKPLFTFSLSHVLLLFYTYPHHRRLYIVYGKGENKTLLPQLDTPASIIYKARGKKFDLIKNALYFLQQKIGDKYFNLPAAFWYELSILAETKNVNQYLIKVLAGRYLNEE